MFKGGKCVCDDPKEEEIEERYYNSKEHFASLPNKRSTFVPEKTEETLPTCTVYNIQQGDSSDTSVCEEQPSTSLWTTNTIQTILMKAIDNVFYPLSPTNSCHQQEPISVKKLH